MPAPQAETDDGRRWVLVTYRGEDTYYMDEDGFFESEPDTAREFTDDERHAYELENDTSSEILEWAERIVVTAAPPTAASGPS
jgi:hypothetical protein